MVTEVRQRVCTDDLQAALVRIVAQHSEGRQRLKRWRRRLSVYSSSYTIENLQVEVFPGKPLQLVLKDLSPSSLLETAQRVRPHFLYDPLREIETYRTTLHQLGLGTPVCYGATVSAELERYWLFLERVSGPLLWQMGRMDSWEHAARWLARLHNEFDTASRPHHQSRLAHLLRYDEAFYAMWPTRAEEFLRHRNGVGSLETLRRFRRLMDRYDRVIQLLIRLPMTFIHGEFYPSNVLLRETKRGRQICPVDWELAAVAPGLIDLAALTSGEWTEEKRGAMIGAYREALEPPRGSPPSMAELTEAVESCQLHIAVQLLGWASDWTPPERHAQNWLREAFRLADRLGM